MTAEEWDHCGDAQAMLRELYGRVGERKLRLLTAILFRSLEDHFTDSRHHRAIELLGRRAEGNVSQAEIRQLVAEMRHALPLDDYAAAIPYSGRSHYLALMLLREFCSLSIAHHALSAAAEVDQSISQRIPLLRCLFSNPFRPIVVDPGWLSFDVVTLTQLIDQTQSFEQMAILSDALLDAGCDDSAILAHCRCNEPHTRGCWVIDLLLGKTGEPVYHVSALEARRRARQGLPFAISVVRRD
jgi:hypothetical protein